MRGKSLHAGIQFQSSTPGGACFCHEPVEKRATMA